MGAIFAYVTTKDKEEARRIGRALLDFRLAACINILGPIESAYWWEGKLEEGVECALLVKSDAANAEAIVDKVKELHSYSCPCVAIWPLTAGNPGYLDWIRKESARG